MESAQSALPTPDPKLAAVCGLFCPACTFFIGSNHDRARLERLSERLGRGVGELECHGCRSEKRAFYCEKHCKMTGCASEQKIRFCVECSRYPCDELITFQVQMSHRIELWESQQRIKEVGYEAWYGEMARHYSCPECHVINSAYDIACRGCGTSPSCEHAARHREEVEKASARLGP